MPVENKNKTYTLTVGSKVIGTGAYAPLYSQAALLFAALTNADKVTYRFEDIRVVEDSNGFDWTHAPNSNGVSLPNLRQLLKSTAIADGLRLAASHGLIVAVQPTVTVQPTVEVQPTVKPTVKTDRDGKGKQVLA